MTNAIDFFQVCIFFPKLTCSSQFHVCLWVFCSEPLQARQRSPSMRLAMVSDDKARCEFPRSQVSLVTPGGFHRCMQRPGTSLKSFALKGLCLQKRSCSPFGLRSCVVFEEHALVNCIVFVCECVCVWYRGRDRSTTHGHPTGRTTANVSISLSIQACDSNILIAPHVPIPTHETS